MKDRTIKKLIKLILPVVPAIFYCAVAAAGYDANELNNLFTDKKQRANIDAARSGQTSVESQKATKVTVNGYMKRSGGKDVVWVNNRSTLESSQIGDIKVQQSNIGKNKRVGVTLDGKHVHLKPGETWHKETGKIVDNQ